MKKSVFGLCFLGGLAGAFAHGLIESPPSRSWICGAVTKPDEVDLGTAKNPVCSTAFALNPLAGYNFMSVVTHSLGRAKVTPLPKHVCGFDGEFWKGAQTPWDVPMQWPATPMSVGPQTITWNVSWGPHFDDTYDFSYWITKSDFVFSPTKALTWDDFETEPFCMETYDDKKPDANPDITPHKASGRFMTRCNMPPRSGHHVIYGEWGRTPPTIERFHGCIDASFGGTSLGLRSGRAAHGIRLFGTWKNSTDLLGRVRKEGSAMPTLPRTP